MLQREARQLWQILAGEQVRMGPSDQQAKQQTAFPPRRRRACQTLGRHAHSRTFRQIGKALPCQAQDALMGDLTLLFTPAQRRSPR